MNFILILNSKIVEKELRSRYGKIPPVLVPLFGGTVLDYVYKNIKNNYDRIVLIGFEEFELIKNFISKRKYDIDLVKLRRLKDLGFSVNKGLEYIMKKYDHIDNVTVLFGDTIIKNVSYRKILGKNKVFYSKTIDARRWTTFDVSDGKLTIFDKIGKNGKKEHKTFVGLFNFNDPKYFSKQIVNNLKAKRESFYNSILDYYGKHKIDFVETKNWIDIGHLDKYLEGKSAIKARFFNHIHIDRKKGVVKKTSKNDKLNNEILWYLRLPKGLQYLAPRIFDYDLSYENSFVEMEYYAYPTLHEVYVWGNYDFDYWKKVFADLSGHLLEMNKYTKRVDKIEVKKILNKIYCEKTLSRLEDLRREKGFIQFFDKNIIINGKEFKSLNEYIEDIKRVSKDLDTINKLNIIHGDFHFSNILYDFNSGLIRLIDPRGDFGGAGIYGDFRYDWAKLLHSIRGKFDFIIEDLFTIEVKENKIEFEIFSNEIHDKIESLFTMYLIELGIEKSVQLIEALLFLSMLPLHKDYPKRQMVMLANGIIFLQKYMDER